MTLLTSWSLTSPNNTHFVASISTAGVVTFTPGSQITSTPPVYPDQTNGSLVWTPSISNAGVVTLTSGANTGQDTAGLIDANGAVYRASVLNEIAYFLAPKIAVGDLLSVGLVEQETVAMLVRAIEPGPDLSATLTLVDAAPGVHAAATGVIPPFESHVTTPVSVLPSISAPRIDEIRSDESVMLRASDGSLVARLLVTVSQPSGPSIGPVDLEVQTRPSGSNGQWDRFVVSGAAVVEQAVVSQVEEGVSYDVRARLVTSLGATSDWATVLGHVVVGKTSLPPAVGGLTLNGSLLQWSYPNAPLDLAGFLVRVHVGQRNNWSDAIPLHGGVVSATQFMLHPDAGSRTYLVKAVDTSGLESAAPAELFVAYGALTSTNVVERIDLREQGFPGTVTGGFLFAGDLVANATTLMWTDDANPMWTDDANPMWTAIYDEVIYLATVTPPVEWLAATLLLDVLVVGGLFHLDYSLDGQAPMWSSDSNPMWSGDSNPMWDPTISFLPWPGQLTALAHQPLLLRLTMPAGPVRGQCAGFAAVFDLPDLEELLVNVLIASTGTRLPVTKAFSAIQLVRGTVVEDGSSAVRFRIMDKFVTGPLVLPVDVNNVPVAAHGDFEVRGY